MLGIKDAIKRIYSGENALVKHIILFILTGVPLLFTTPLNEISQRPVIKPEIFWLSLLALALCAVIGIYLGGYLYGFMKNSFDETKEEILPEFNKGWFKIFFKGFPLQLTWMGYFLAVMLVSILAGTLLDTIFSIKISVICTYFLILLFTVLVGLSLPLVFAKFSQNYDRTGLYSFTLPFKLFGKAHKSVLMLVLKLIPLFILVGVINLLGSGTNVLSYIFTAIGGYFATIVQYVAGFCYVQIYKDEIDNI